MAAYNSGSVQDAAPCISRQQEHDDIRLTMTAGTAVGDPILMPGQEVYISSAGTVKARTLGTQFPIGTISVGKNTRLVQAQNNKVTVNTIFNKDVFGKTAAPITAGSFVRHDGTYDGDGYPNIVAAVAGDYCIGIALTTSVAGGALRTGVFRSVIKL